MHEKTGTNCATMEDLDKYLSGEMNDAERQRFEAKLATDEDLNTLQDLRLGLKHLHLKKKTGEVAILRQQWRKKQIQKNWLRWGFLIGISLLGVFIGYKKYFSSTAPAEKTVPERQGEEVVPGLKESGTTKKEPESKTKRKYTGPIADGGVVDHFDVETGSTMRGVYEDLDSLSLQVLDTLIIYTTQLPPPSKRENWNKALEQLIGGKPQLAKSYIFELEKTDAQEARWLLAVALLAEGRNDESLEILQTIAQKPEHPRSSVAARALDLLEN